MTDPRIMASVTMDMPIPVVTYIPTDFQYLGTWSKPNVPFLIYPGNTPFFTSHQHRFHGGAIAGAPGGHPVQLIYWGSFWNTTAGSDKQLVITPAVQRMLDSNYFSWLTQYGVPHAPTWRGAMVCSQPAPPMRADRQTARETMMDMIQALIDDGKLPDPDDGPRICYVVVMPDGFVMTEADVAGAHSSYDRDFPFSGNRFWAGWIAPSPDLMEVLRIISHEVVETLVDPEGDAWRWIPVGSKEKVSELCDGSENQTAFVNDTRVQAYWSQFHSAPIIPIDNDYGAQLNIHMKETSRVETNQGPFAPSNALCSAEAPDCCFAADEHYEWHTFAMEEDARISINTTRFREPDARWFVNNNEIKNGDPPLSLTVDMETYSGLASSIAPATITIDSQVLTDPPRLVLKPQGTHGNFDVFVRCEVTDKSITGSPNINVIATPQVQVGFRRQETLIDDAYGLKLGRCYASLAKKFNVKYKPTGTPKREEGINWVTEAAALGLPAYVRASQYERIRELAGVARATRALLGERAVEAQREQMLELVPVLGAVVRRARERSSDKGESAA